MEKENKVVPISQLIAKVRNSHQKTGLAEINLADPIAYKEHSLLIKEIGNSILLNQGKEFIIDDNNKLVLKYLLYYFNNQSILSDIFPIENYSNDKNILLCGQPGTGKTLIFQIFNQYLRLTKNENIFTDVSITQMMNYYKMNNHLNKYTYNEAEEGNSIYGSKFEGSPIALCMNDILGLDKQLHFGTDIQIFINDFIFSRYEIWQQQKVKTHATHNLTKQEVNDILKDNRLIDRMKMFNVIFLGGESKRK